MSDPNIRQPALLRPSPAEEWEARNREQAAQNLCFLVTGNLESILGVVIDDEARVGYIRYRPGDEDGHSSSAINLRASYPHALRASLMHLAHLTSCAAKETRSANSHSPDAYVQPRLFPQES